MAQDSKIEWTDHTFSPSEFDPSRRCGDCTHPNDCERGGFGVADNCDDWTPLPATPEADWKWRIPLKWNAAAERAGKPARVFFGSKCDWAEDREDLVEPRQRLFGLMLDTPWLEWLLLTKRAQSLHGLVPMLPVPSSTAVVPIPNVRIGVSIENQETADQRLPHLRAIKDLGFPTFVSAEPLLGPVDLSAYLRARCPGCGGVGTDGGDGGCDRCEASGEESVIDWLIVGGENGPGARVMERRWAIALHHHSRQADVPFFFKGYGSATQDQRQEEDYERQFPEPLTISP